jgi:large repetitive protein
MQKIVFNSHTPKKSRASIILTLIAMTGLSACTNGTIPPNTIPTQFTTDSFLDTIDAAPGDKICADAETRCSLRAAIMESNVLEGPQTIALKAGTYTLTIVGAGENAGKTGDLDLFTDLTINGAEAATTVIDANGLDRVFEASNPNITNPVVVLKSLTIKGGAANGDGGGFLASNAKVSLENVLFTGNSSTADGGGLRTLYGTVSVKNSLFSTNTADGSGGGFASETAAAIISNSQFTGNTARASTSGLGGGGGLYAGQTLEIAGSMFTTNKASNGFGGGVLSKGQTTISTSNSSENQAVCGGGVAIVFFSNLSITASSVAGNAATQGAGICVGDKSTLTLTNATISGNQASDFGGGLRLISYAKAKIVQSTFAGNTATASKGLDIFSESFAEGTVRASILASTGGSSCATNDSTGIASTLTSTGANVVADATCAFSSANDLQSANAQLAVLSPVANQVFSVRIPALASPAVNRVPAGLCSSVDARGVTRPQGLACDSGAVERTTSDP